MAEQDLDRTQEATDYKLKKAKEKGQVSKSADLVSAVVFAVAVVFLTAQGWQAVRGQFRFDQALLTQISMLDATGGLHWPLLAQAIQKTLSLCAPFFGAIMLAAIVANVMQTGPILSAEPVMMDFSRINPVNGLKKLFSMRTLFDAFRACVKLVLLGWVAYAALQALAPQFYGLSHLSAVGYVRTLLDDMSSLGLKMALILGLIALLDVMFSRREFAKKMRMSHREVKDEVKHRDGDPRIRARLRELRRDMLKRSLAVRQTRKADVLVTNPTHVAVALRYEHGKMQSPQLVAKGAGQLAAMMRDIAAKHQIPVVRSPALARRLYREMEVEQHVPPWLFAEVARIVVWVFAMREQQAQRHGAAPAAAAAAAQGTAA
jgi:flagellar biosynthetic protein FlhB